jgi:dihydrofolate synthase / folylpolyglutamate synthase
MNRSSKEYQQRLKFLFDLQFFGIKLGLENIRALVAALGNPHRSYPVIHVAGTNGKGSTAAMIAAIFTASGYRTGLYTSPHLIKFNERIRIDGEPILDDDVVLYTRLLERTIVARRATFFEATTAMAFQYFADHSVDVAVVEAGLGGRFDATNVVEPVLSIITSIGLDHTEHLGGTLAEIANEKGGIIKYGVPCVTGTDAEVGYDTLKAVCRVNHSKLRRASRQTELFVNESTLSGSSVDISVNGKNFKSLFLSLAGEFQTQNARTALLAVEYLGNTGFPRLAVEENIRNGLKNVSLYTGLRGRIDVLQTNPIVICDVGHNPPAIERLCSTISKLYFGEFIVVFGLMRDKDINPMISPLSRLSKFVIAVQPKTDRALGGNEILAKFHSRGHKAVNGGSVEHGIELAYQEAGPHDAIAILGSHFVVSEAMERILH